MIRSPTCNQPQTAALCIPPGDTRFYDHMFRRHPEYHTMFRNSFAGQAMKFMSTLATILDVLTVPSAFDRDVLDLGRNHRAEDHGTSPCALGRRSLWHFPRHLGVRLHAHPRRRLPEAFALIAGWMIEAEPQS